MFNKISQDFFYFTTIFTVLHQFSNTSQARCTIESTSWLETPAHYFITPLLIKNIVANAWDICRYQSVWRVCVASSVDAAKGTARCSMVVISQRVASLRQPTHSKYQSIPSQFVREHEARNVECLYPGVAIWGRATNVFYKLFFFGFVKCFFRYVLAFKNVFCNFCNIVFAI